MTIQRASFYVLLFIITIAFVWLLIPYYTAVLWAVILAILFSRSTSGWSGGWVVAQPWRHC